MTNRQKALGIALMATGSTTFVETFKILLKSEHITSAGALSDFGYV